MDDDQTIIPNPGDDAGWPTELVEPSANDPAVSPDFVDRVEARVLADRARILEEAARVDEVDVPAAWAGALPAPEPSAGFVDRVAEAVARDRAARAGRDAFSLALQDYGVPAVSRGFVDRVADRVAADRQQWRRLLRRYDVPRVSEGFVERTVAALGRGAPQREPVDAPAGTGARVLQGPDGRTGRRWLAAAFAAAAAVVVLAVGQSFAGPAPDPQDTQLPAATVGQEPTADRALEEAESLITALGTPAGPGGVVLTSNTLLDRAVEADREVGDVEFRELDPLFTIVR